MDVPDWPTTYRYNLFLYPWQDWLLGPWGLFIEHGHRLLGALSGLLTIALVVALWRFDSRRWMRRLGIVALLAVIAQGCLGGARVLLDARLIAQIHACVGPAFFALSVGMAVFTSCRWRQSSPARNPRSLAASRLAVVTAALVYVQLLIGSQLRHVTPDVAPAVFRAAVLFHLFMAAVLVVHVALLAGRTLGIQTYRGWLARPAWTLAVLTLIQVTLGAATWVLNYGWPAWCDRFPWTEGFLVQRESFTQASVTTAHVAMGSLMLALAFTVALRSLRLSRMHEDFPVSGGGARGALA